MKSKLLFSSLMIISMVFSGLNVSLADGNEVLSSDDVTFSIPEMTAIVNNSSVLSATATPTSKTSITLNSPLNVIFNVSTTKSGGTKVALRATAPVDTNSIITSRFPYTNYVVFTKADGSTTTEAASNVNNYNVSSISDNPNAIAFPIQCSRGEAAAPEPIMEGSYFGYEVGVAYPVYGEKEISCTISGDSKTNSFGMNDTPGNYTATITLSQFNAEEAYYDDSGID